MLIAAILSAFSRISCREVGERNSTVNKNNRSDHLVTLLNSDNAVNIEENVVFHRQQVAFATVVAKTSRKPCNL